MSALPLMLDGARFTAVVIGGGAVATRKTRALLESGVRVEVIAPAIDDELHSLAETESRLTLQRRAYAAGDIRRGCIVIAATDDAAVNRRVAQDAVDAGCLVNVVDDPDAGNFVTPAVHRAGDLTVAVSTGRVPAAAAAIRTSLAQRFDGRYASAISSLRDLRDSMLRDQRRDDWKRVSAEITGAPDFCDAVEQGRIDARLAEWR